MMCNLVLVKIYPVWHRVEKTSFTLFNYTFECDDALKSEIDNVLRRIWK